MDTLKDFFSTAPYLAWSAVSVVLAMVVIAANWPLARWWWHNTWYSFPLFGKIARFSKDSNRDTVQKDWFKAEKTLCRDYKQFIRIQDEYDFNEKNTYLSKAGDLGRRSTPGLIWVLNVALVFVEAMGFSYVLAGYTIPGASENMQQMGALGIAFLVSVVLVVLTHESGHITFRNTQINFARKEWIEAGRTGKLSTGTMALAKPQGEDDHLPNYVQLCNRVGTVPSYLLPISTAVFVVAVATGAFYVRGQVMEKILQQQVTGQTNEAQGTSKTSSIDVLNMSTDKSNQALSLPSEDAAANQRAVNKAIADEADIDRHGGWGTFAVLTFIFVFLQILGVFFGFKWGFAGRESKAAFEAVGAGRYATYSDVRVHYKEIADIAQSKLEQLQQKLMQRNANSGTDGLHTSKTFYEFMDHELNREAAERQRELQRTAQRGTIERVQAPDKISTRTSNSERPVDDIALVREASGINLERALETLHGMGVDKESKKAYIQTLSAELQNQVMQRLRVEKETAARLASQRDAELDNLL